MTRRICLASAALWGGWWTDRVIEVFSLGALISHIVHVLGSASPLFALRGLLWCFVNNEGDDCELGKAICPHESQCISVKEYFGHKIFKHLFNLLT